MPRGWGGGVGGGGNSGTLGPNLVILDVFKSTEHDNVTDDMRTVHIVDLDFYLRELLLSRSVFKRKCSDTNVP